MNIGTLLGIKEEDYKKLESTFSELGEILKEHTAAMKEHTLAMQQASLTNDALTQAIITSGDNDKT